MIVTIAAKNAITRVANLIGPAFVSVRAFFMLRVFKVSNKGFFIEASRVPAQLRVDNLHVMSTCRFQSFPAREHLSNL